MLPVSLVAGLTVLGLGVGAVAGRSLMSVSTGALLAHFSALISAKVYNIACAYRVATQR